ncbi:MAG TPA: sugar ABC transporter permease [Spirochaetia bacterium]|nr:sugar ABC transporter permease [Spirochaetia bacterium]
MTTGSVRKSAKWGYLFIAPLFAAVFLLLLYPMFDTIIISFSDMKLVNIAERGFVGLENYRALFTQKNPSFLSGIMRVTMIFVVFSVVLQVGMGLILALILHLRWLKGRLIFRNVLLLPWVTAGVIAGFSWKFLFNNSIGVLNYLISLVGIAPQAWLSDPRWVIPSIVFANVWKGTTYSLLIQTAGLQSIPDELYDVAVVDGATKLRALTRITLPLLLPFLFINLLTETGDTFHVFDRIYALTGGGPLHSTELLSIFMYRNSFVYGELGMGASVAVFELLIGLVFALMYIFVFRQERV